MKVIPKANGPTPKITAERAITQIGGRLEGNRIYLDAGRDIEFSTRTHTTGNGVTRIGTLVEKRAQVKARESISFNAGNDLRLKGVDVNSGGDTRIQAGGDLRVGPIASYKKTDVRNGADFYKHQSVQYQGSTVISEGKLELISGENTLIQGSELVAQDSLSVVAGQQLIVEATRDESHTESEWTNTGYKESTHSYQDHSITHNRSSLDTAHSGAYRNQRRF